MAAGMRTKIQKGIYMETEAMYGGRGVACMMPQTFDCTGRIRHSIEPVSILCTGSVIWTNA